MLPFVINPGRRPRYCTLTLQVPSASGFEGFDLEPPATQVPELAHLAEVS